MINFFILMLSSMLQLAAAAPRLFVPLFMLLLNIIAVIILTVVIMVSVPTYPQMFRVNQLTNTSM